MHRFIRRLLIPALVMAFCAGQANAGEILVDFEYYPGPDRVLGTADDVPSNTDYISSLTNEYATIGLNFESTSLFRSPFFNDDPENHFISSTRPMGIFSIPVTGISIDSYSYWNATLTAFDVAGNVLTSHVLHNPFPGSQPLRGTLSVTSAAPIHSFTISGDNRDYILNVDNLRFTVAADVPEPGQLGLFASGILLMGALLRRKKALSTS